MKLNRRALDKATEAVPRYMEEREYKRPIARRIVEAYLTSIQSQWDRVADEMVEESTTSARRGKTSRSKASARSVNYSRVSRLLP